MANDAGPLIALGVVALVIGAAAGGKRRKKAVVTDDYYEFPDEPVGPVDEPVDEPVGDSDWEVITKWPSGGAPEALWVGGKNHPETVALLNEMRDEFLSAGVNLEWITPEEVTALHKKGYGGKHAIPPREYWPRMIQTILTVFHPIRAQYGKPIKITNGYRPPFYNLLVTQTEDKPEGNPGSRHQWFEALDMIPVEEGAEGRQELGLLAANIWNTRGVELAMGLGVYPPREWPGGLHFDTGSKKRKWADSKYWIDLAKSGIAGRSIAGRRARRGARRHVHMDARSRLMVQQARRRAA